jgi:hypothetical protein
MADTSKPEEEKVNTTVTYRPAGDRKRPVTIQGITFAPGQAVNLEELMPKERAERLARQLNRNRFFQEDRTEQDEYAQRVDEQNRRAREATRDAMARPGRARPQFPAGLGNEGQDQEAYVNQQRQSAGVAEGGEPPEDYKAPETARLETPSPERQQQRTATKTATKKGEE